MIKIERTSVMNFENAIRGARNPMNSWGRMDSHTEPDGTFVFGENDLSLAKRLCKAGTDHRKFIRQIFVSVDLTAPIYWWKEFDTYKVGTVANSTSTMHKIQAKTFEEADFSCDRMVPAAKESLMQTIGVLEKLRVEFVEKKDKDLWYSLIQLFAFELQPDAHLYHELREHCEHVFCAATTSWTSGTCSVHGQRNCRILRRCLLKTTRKKGVKYRRSVGKMRCRSSFYF